MQIVMTGLLELLLAKNVMFQKLKCHVTLWWDRWMVVVLAESIYLLLHFGWLPHIMSSFFGDFWPPPPFPLVINLTLLAWTFTTSLNHNITIWWGFFRQTAPATMPVHVGTNSLKKPHHIVILRFSDVVKGHAKWQKMAKNEIKPCPEINRVKL